MTDEQWAEHLFHLRMVAKDEEHDDMKLSLLAWADCLEERGEQELSEGMRLLATHPYGPRVPARKFDDGRNVYTHYRWTSENIEGVHPDPFLSSIRENEFTLLKGIAVRDGYLRKTYKTLLEAYLDGARAVLEASKEG